MGLLIDLGYLIAAVFTFPWLIFRMTVRGDWQGLPSRLGRGLPPPAMGSIWLHGASAGEIALLRPVVERLERDMPEAPLVISAYSSTGFAAARKAYPKHRVIFFPVDLSFIVRRFLRWFDPRLVVIVESDFWPNFLLAAKRSSIPVVVLNGKMSDRSYRIHARTRIIPLLLRRLPLIAVQTDEHADRLLRVGVPSEQIKVTGNMKYDLAESSEDAKSSLRLREDLNYSATDTLILAGSLHERENDVFIETFQALRVAHPEIALIIVPRYPNDAGRVRQVLVESGFDAALKTEVDRGERVAPGRNGVLVVDTVGELSSLYAVADIAFVGGSLFYRGSNKGGHNVMEPAILGVPILFGPYNFNFKETVQELLAAGAGMEVRDADELQQALDELLRDQAKREEMGRRAKEVVLRGQGASARNYELLSAVLATTKPRSPPSRFTVWSIVIYFLLPYAMLNLAWRGLRYPAYWARWSERFGYLPPMGTRKSIWVHAVSVGEVRSASELVNSLAKRYPDHRILVTTTTPTGSTQVRELFGDRVSHAYVPYDLPAAVRRFIDRLNPEFAVIAETEFWPNIFRECRRRGIPLLLVNVRVSRASFRGYRRVPLATRAMLASADLLCAQSPRDARELRGLGVAEDMIHVTGNLKFDVPVPDSLLREGERIRDDWGRDRSVMIAASTHRGEERRILTAYRQLLGTHPDLLLVLVPRHPERFSGVARLCRRARYQVVRRTEQHGALDSGVNILVGDTMGELQKLYVASDLAFVGGSLVPIGGHNLLEACAVGVPVIFGPHMFHFEDVSARALERGAGRQVEGVGDLADIMALYLDQPALREAAGSAARSLIAENRGALERTLKLMEDTLDARRGQADP